MTLDEEPVLISERDFTPTPSPSPVPSAEEAKDKAEPSMSGEEVSAAATEAAAGANAEDERIATGGDDDATKDELNASAVVSDDEDVGEKIVSSEDDTTSDPSDPTSEDVKTVEELGISITDPPAVAIPPQPEEAVEEEEEEEEPAPAVPTARQIVSIGREDDSYAFTFHEEELNAILSKIPAGWKVCVVSVVGAFRTGKSFLLSWFLRYLEAHCVRRGGANSVSDNDDGKKWYERVQTLNQHEGSFDWRGGKERNTTGMWMWSDPYFLPRQSGDEVAILLVDTQGMFDHETTVGLTAAIFGLSTLLSSYQIYNVDKRIQEDNLQQLALFSEYGRMAFEAEEKAKSAGEAEEGQETVLTHKGPAVPSKRPFQKIEFLVRDFQNFETEDEEDIAAMEGEMSAYLEHVIAARAAADLKETREQINACFEEIACFMMTHPGFAVIKNKYEGDVGKIEPLFMRLLDRYCQRVFDTKGGDGDDAAPPRLEPKTVRGRELSAVELATYVKYYAQMFEEIGAHFPKAETMLEATSKANNANAVNASVEAYSSLMSAVAGPQVHEYHQGKLLQEKHKQASGRALLVFDEMANFGSRTAIEEARDKVMQKIVKDYEVFTTLNDGRNPLLGLETYLLPMLVAGLSFLLRWVADFTCSSWSQTCRASSELLSHIYMVVFFFLIIVASTKAKQITDLINRAKAAYGVLSNSSSKEKKD